ncbi:MAG TPA: response regulator [Longimicrobium sp.]|nr:response regulator [Longimicrobium sp.]
MMYQSFEQLEATAKTVLIVEDQLEMRAINAMYLHHHGYRVLAADNGIDGIQAAREAAPDLILMDISIPGIDGIRATEQLKRDPATGHIPVVIITAHPYGSVGRRAQDAGCDGYLTKPCDPRRVLQEVRRRLGEPAAH